MQQVNWEEYGGRIFTEKQKQQIIKQHEEENALVREKKNFEKNLNRYKKYQLKEYALMSGAKFGGNKKKIISQIYENEGAFCKLLREEPEKKRIKKEKEEWNELDEIFLEKLGAEINSTMQDECMNFTKNCKFGFFQKKTFEKMWEKDQMKFLRRRRLQRGHLKKEIWFKEEYESHEIPDRLKKYVTVEYSTPDYMGFDSRKEIFLIKGNNIWRMKITYLEINFNWNREYLVFSTKWSREKYDEDNKVWEEW